MEVKLISYNKVKQLENILDEVVNLTSNGEDPNRAIAKVAKKNDLSDETIKLVCRAYNVSNTLNHYSQNDISGPERIDFEIADPKIIFRLLDGYYVESKKEASYKNLEESIYYSDYNDKKIFELNLEFDLDKKVERNKKQATFEEKNNVKDLLNEYYKPNSLVQKVKQSDFEKRNLLKIAKDKFDCYITDLCQKVFYNIDKISSYLKSHPYFLNQVLNECVRFSNENELVILIKKASKNIKYPQVYDKNLYFDSEKEPWKYIKELNELISKIHKCAEIKNKFDKILSKLENKNKEKIFTDRNIFEKGQYEDIFLQNLIKKYKNG